MRYLEHWRAETVVAEDPDSAFETALSAVSEDKPIDVTVVGASWDPEEHSALRQRLMDAPELERMRFVFLQPRQRKSVQQIDDLTIVLDASPASRASFARAVAASVGRASPEINAEVGKEKITGRGEAPIIEDARRSGQLVLVADDNATNRDVIGRQLNLLGYAAEIFDNGKQAFEAYQNKGCAILLTDCCMPEMDGFELTAAIRKNETSLDTRLPIIAITANALRGEAERCLAAGMDDYLSKPTETRQLDHALAKGMPKTAEAPFGGDDTENASNLPSGYGAPSERPTDQLETTHPINDANEKPLDEQALKNMFGDDPEMIHDILKSFVAPATDSVREILQAIEDHSAARNGSAAHKLKSSARTVGANKLADLCVSLERAGNADDWEEIANAAPHIEAALSEVADHIGSL